MGALSHWPAGKHEAGEKREIYRWDDGKRLGAIPQVPETYNVVGNTNEHQLTIGESTFGGLEMLDASGDQAVCDPDHGCIDYGQLIWVTLGRAKTAREAITTMDHLMQTYGYASSGESFSIADTKEVWLMEVIGKGNITKGSVWVATKIPDGSVCAHANQARTTKFIPNQPDVFQHSPDVITFAKKLKLYDGEDADFSFSDVYDPLTFEGARFCEARVYSFFSKIAADEERITDHLDYVKGYNLTNRMPLYVKARHPVSVNETMWHMRNHFEGMWFDPSKDVSAGPWQGPERLGVPLTYKTKGKEYVNERFIGTQYTGWGMVANQRPAHKFSVLWFGVDDASFSVRVPFYGATTRVPTTWSDANCTGLDPCRKAHGLPGTMLKFSMHNMFWINSLVANYAYSRYDAIAPAVQRRLVEIEGELMHALEKADAEVDKADNAVEEATKFSYTAAERVHKAWMELFGELFTTYVDGYTAVPDPTNKVCECKKQQNPFPAEWNEEVAARAGDHYRVPDATIRGRQGVIPKTRLAALGGGVSTACEQAEEVVV